MDIFSIVPDAVNSTWRPEAVISGITSKLWVERYKSPGEFKFTATPNPDLIDALELGTLISHTNTRAVMIVEDHEINEEAGQVAELTITGRTADSFLESRVATDEDMGFDPSLYDGTAWPYILPAAWPWEHAVDLMLEQLIDNPDHSSFNIPYANAAHEIDLGTVELDPGWNTIEELELKRSSLATAIRDICNEHDFGVRVDRPFGGQTKLRFVIYQGIDKSGTVQFSYEAGDFATARYFRSIKNDRNAAYIHSKYYGRFRSESGATGFWRKVLLVDATDFNALAGTSGWTLSKINTNLNRRASKAMKRAKTSHLLEATMSPRARFKFRHDYDIGDKVYARGNNNFDSLMRVTEFTEIEDDQGEYGFPTLKSIRA
jgi:hypothetical protein